MFRIILAIVLFIGGIALGVYVGVWLMFIGGIIQLIEQIRAETLIPMQVAIGIARIIFAGAAGDATAAIFIIISNLISE